MEIKLNMTKDTDGTVVYTDAAEKNPVVTGLYLRKKADNGKALITEEKLEVSANLEYEGDSKGGNKKIYAPVNEDKDGAFGKKVYVEKNDSTKDLGDNITLTFKASKKSLTDPTKGDSSVKIFKSAKLTVS